MNGALTLDGVSLRYGERRALDGVSLSVEAGGRVAVLGRSGAGKTSLLRVIAGLQAPESGVVRLGEETVTDGPTLTIPPEERRVSLVFQGLALWPHMTVEQTLSWVGRADSTQARREAARALAKGVGLGGRLSAFPAELSGGEQQRLAIARALASEPTLLLMDEPFAHLDAALRDGLTAELLQLVEERGTTLVLVTHQRETALNLASRLIVLDAGAVKDSGDTESLLDRPGCALTVELLGLGSVLAGEAAGGSVATAAGTLTADEHPADGACAVLVRPEQVELCSDGDDLAAGVVLSCSLTRPDSVERRYGVEVKLGSARIHALTERAWAAGDDVRVSVSGVCGLLSP